MAKDKSASAPANPTDAKGQPAPQISFDSERIAALYSNFARVTGSPEELIIDFGLNPQPFGGQSEAVPISQRIVMNYYTAKRFLGALQMAVQRHEQAFGVLETDVNKRVVSGGAPKK
ncbi:DUF3467 domain-containing protein [Symmachiella dynata]|uniref:DUF3467 domain-containing protein n=1 Tax=Symmachiella dynata TaxID=2527995 RepID=A0A517ZIA4_9PLAN|nr:DUF3467 domain-containing protein [Symmachiella dynata]QDT46686.1 hypothetical protein Pan258_07050 [Symmachiella dynata]QDU42198.1 hypothetical protein Mal52_06530 [Symmachiella dynata]|tara:strand:- start:245 stop:595 length:351 start_codon:yes stop_codon:yes gene_type:complete